MAVWKGTGICHKATKHPNVQAPRELNVELFEAGDALLWATVHNCLPRTNQIIKPARSEYPCQHAAFPKIDKRS